MRRVFSAAALLLISACAGAPAREPAAASSAAPYSEANIRKLFVGKAWVIIGPAELKKYDDLYAASDFHGRLEALLNMFHVAHLISSASPDAKWVGKNKLVVLAGDYIDGGPDSAQILSFLKTMVGQAKPTGSWVVVLLGNHEARLLSHFRPKDMEEETRASFAKDLGIEKPPKMTKEDLEKSDLHKFLSSMPIACLVGSWFVAHSGYIGQNSASDLPKYTSELSKIWDVKPSDEEKSYEMISDQDGKGYASVVSRHDWWVSHHKDYHEFLNSIGITALLGGHEPSLFGTSAQRSHVLLSNGGWAVKLDSDLKANQKAPGEMLHCQIKDILQADGSLKLADDKAHSPCTHISGDGSERDLTTE